MLKKKFRNPEGIEKVKSACESLGLTATASGLATLSVRTEAEYFEKIFGVVLERKTRKEISNRDFGESGGFIADESILIPESLKKYVDNISVEPPVTRLR
ncbi:hypothetical protein ACFL17_04345 [Pseudomonadota bacterium]